MLITQTQRKLQEERAARLAKWFPKPVLLVVPKQEPEPKPEHRPKAELVVASEPSPLSLAHKPIKPPPSPVEQPAPLPAPGRVAPFNGNYGKCKHIQTVVAIKANVALKDMIGTSRRARIVEPRFIAIYLVREIVGGSWPQIGRRFGWRDHTSVLHGYRKVSTRMKADPEFAAEVETLKAQIQQQFGERAA